MATLSQGIGISISQLAKYENGTNRISPARLSKIAEILDMPIAWFFETEVSGTENNDEHVHETQRLLVAFRAIPEPDDRLRVVELAEHLCRAKRTP